MIFVCWYLLPTALSTKDERQACNGVKRNYCPCVMICAGFCWLDVVAITLEYHNTNLMHAACYKVMGSKPTAARYFFISALNSRVAYVAKVLPKS